MSLFRLSLPSVALCQLVISALATSAYAQGSELTLTGVIHDNTGKAPRFSLLRIPTLHLEVKVGPTGRFRVPIRVKPGCYEVVAVSIGFGNTVQAVHVRPGMTAVDVGPMPLQPAPVHEQDAFVLGECRPDARTRYATGGFYVTGKDSVP